MKHKAKTCARKKVSPGCRNRLTKEVKYVPLNLKSVDETGQFEGYASLFQLPDLEKDVVAPGAFGRSLKKRGVFGIKMLFQHDPGEVIGVWQDIHEDRRGLYVRGQLLMDVSRAREVHSLMLAGALNGLSIGFRTLKSRRDSQTRLRHLLEVDLWEISVVTFPMQSEARIETVKADIGMAAYAGHVSVPLTLIMHQAAQKMRSSARYH